MCCVLSLLLGLRLHSWHFYEGGRKSLRGVSPPFLAAFGKGWKIKVEGGLLVCVPCNWQGG